MCDDVINITYQITKLDMISEKYKVSLVFEHENGTIEKIGTKIFDSKLDAMIFAEKHQFGFFENS